MIFSVLLLGFGFLVRAYKLFRTLSTTISHHIQPGIDTCHYWMLMKWTQAVPQMYSSLALALTLFMLPLLSSIIFTVKFFLDFYASMLFEVGFSQVLSLLKETRRR
jgi:hypothetical protein